MTFIRATPKQIEAIKNLCFNRSNLYYVYETLEHLSKDNLYQLSIGDAKEIISTLLDRGNKWKTFILKDFWLIAKLF